MSCLALACLAVLGSLFDRTFGAPQALLLFVVFFCIAQGNDMFGVLSSRAARLLGMTSYSIYLMHAIVLFVALRIADHLHGILSMGASGYWAFIALCGVVVVGLSAGTFRYIEHPFLRRGTAPARAAPPRERPALESPPLES
jgi:peptidoglycan/LPS O-acetylase OafA/YrhL